MTQSQVKEQLTALIDVLPPEQAELVLDFASLLRHRYIQAVQQALPQANPRSADSALTWEEALASAEVYWFQLPETTRQQYSGRTVALLRNRILDADEKLRDLRKRVTALYPDQPVLYLDADAEQEPPLFVRSPRWE